MSLIQGYGNRDVNGKEVKNRHIPRKTCNRTWQIKADMDWMARHDVRYLTRKMVMPQS